MKKREIDVPLLFRLWGEGKKTPEICKSLGIPRGSLNRIVRRHKLPLRNHHRPYTPPSLQRVKRERIDTPGDGFDPRVDPTPEEIAERAKWIRENVWTESRFARGTEEADGGIRCYSWSHTAKKFSTVAY